MCLPPALKRAGGVALQHGFCRLNPSYETPLADLHQARHFLQRHPQFALPFEPRHALLLQAHDHAAYQVVVVAVLVAQGGG